MSDNSTEIFEQNRARLFRLAYGMLGSVASAEDAVQETYLRWQKEDLYEIRSPAAWLSTVISRICLDEIKSARNHREQYIGTFLPEPLLESEDGTPEEHAELADSLSIALLHVLEKLTPVQRAVFILHEVFDYDYTTIAKIVHKTEPNCRKIAQRARENVGRNKPWHKPTGEKHSRLVKMFLEAAQNGNTTAMEKMLAEDIVFYSDGGGKVTAARKPIKGVKKIARFMLGIQKHVTGELYLDLRNVNGHPGMVAYMGGKLFSVWSFIFDGDKIKNIFVVLNPDKLKHIKQNPLPNSNGHKK